MVGTVREPGAPTHLAGCGVQYVRQRAFHHRYTFRQTNVKRTAGCADCRAKDAGIYIGETAGASQNIGEGEYSSRNIYW